VLQEDQAAKEARSKEFAKARYEKHKQDKRENQMERCKQAWLLSDG
jgi:hypothetical protein